MWDLLADFSKGVLAHHFSENEDLPMAKLVRRLQKKKCAKSVHVYTSLFTFVITLQPEYKSKPKDLFTVSFDRRTITFLIGYYDVKTNLGKTYCCLEKQAESLVDALVLRMFLTANNEFLKIEAEETPAFQIGQQVETILDDYSRKYHKGVIFEIVKHHQQNRFMYFIEENGKKLKKRYFKDNLRIV